MQPKLHDEYSSSVFKKLNKQISQPSECPVRLWKLPGVVASDKSKHCTGEISSGSSRYNTLTKKHKLSKTESWKDWTGFSRLYNKETKGRRQVFTRKNDGLKRWQKDKVKICWNFRNEFSTLAGMMTRSDQTYATTGTALNVAFDVSSRSTCSSTLSGTILSWMFQVLTRLHCCQHQRSLYNITTLLTVTCLSNNHTHIGLQYSMNRSFGKA